MRESLSTTFSIDELITLMAEGRLALPNFQREFVWNDRHVAEFLASLLRGWPTGSLLFVERNTAAADVALKPLFGQELSPNAVTHLVLDGHQRLTALWEAFGGTSDRAWTIDTQVLAREASIEEVREGIRPLPRTAAHASRETGSEWRVPFEELRSIDDFAAWRNSTSEDGATGRSRSRSLILADRYRLMLSNISTYRFSVSILGGQLSDDDLAEVFQTINTAGVPLSSFDLLVAKLSAEDWNIRDAWDQACDEYDELREYVANDGMMPIDLITLLETDQIGRSWTNSLSRDVIRTHYGDAVGSIALAARFLRNECGVMGPGFLPHRSFLLVVAAIAMRGWVLDPEDVRRWFFSSSFERGLGQLGSKWLAAQMRMLGESPGSSRERTFPSGAQLSSLSRKREPIASRALLCLLALQVRRSLTFQEEVVVSHVIPAAVHPALADRACNLALLSRRDNAFAAKRDLRELVGDPSQGDRFHHLEKQFVRVGEVMLEPEQFVLRRATEIADALQALH